MDFKNINILTYHTSGGTLVRRSIHELIGGFDETMLKLQDTDYCWNSTCRHKLHFLPDAVVHYRLRDKVDLYDQARLWESTMSSCIKYRPLGMPKLSNKGVKAWLRLLKSFQKSFQGRSTYLGVEICRAHRKMQGCIKYRVLAL